MNRKVHRLNYALNLWKHHSLLRAGEIGIEEEKEKKKRKEKEGKEEEVGRWKRKQEKKTSERRKTKKKKKKNAFVSEKSANIFSSRCEH